MPIETEKDPYQMISYCVSEWPSKWNISKNSLDQTFTFAELYEQRITSEQLYVWSTSMDIVQRYQSYLNQVSTTNEILLATQLFYSCRSPNFGPFCQYSFDYHQPHHSSLNELIHDFYLSNNYDPTTLTCYIHLQCDLGLV
jgi:hypothetical protein